MYNTVYVRQTYITYNDDIEIRSGVTFSGSRRLSDAERGRR